MPKVNKVIQSFNAGELSELMDARIDQAKYTAGCRTLENFIPLIYGGAQRRTGTEFIAAQKSNSAKGRLVAFEHSVDDTYILLFENQVIRVFKDGAQVLDNVGTEDLSALDNIIAHWLLNEDLGTIIIDDEGNHNGTATVDASTLTTTGKVGSGCFDLDGQYTVEISDHDDFSFTDNSNDSTFSIAAWIFVTQSGLQNIVSKWRNDSTTREWRLSLTDDKKLQLHLADTSTSLVNSVVCQWKLNDDAANTNVISSLPAFTIDDADAGNNKFIISDDGNLSSSFPNSSEFTIAGSTGNDGQFTVVSTSFSDPDFTINVASVTDGTDDGTISPHAGVSEDSNTEDINATGQINGALDFGGDQAMTIDDSSDFSFDDSGSNPFSIAAWVFVTNTNSFQYILTKWQNTDDREWAFSLGPDEELRFSLGDETNTAFAGHIADDSIPTGWHFVVATYDSTGGATAGDGVTLYVDGVEIDSTAVNDSSYVQMRDGDTDVVIGGILLTAGVVTPFYPDKIDNVILFDVELTQAQILALWNDGNGTETLSAAVPTPFVVSDDSISAGWHFVTCTYSAPADETTAADGIILYVDGVAVDSTATNDANYKAMQNGAEEARIGSQRNSGDNANENFWEDKIDEVSIFNDVLTPTEVASLYSTTPFEITSPYLTADLFELKFEQSADVIFIAHPSYEPRRLSRTGDTLWTLGELDSQTGPFRDENTDTSFTITASAITGSVTLTASGTNNNPFVGGTTAGHEPSGSAATSKSLTGALFKLVHASNLPSVAGALTTNSLNDTHTALAVPKGVSWDFTTNGTWGTAGNSASVVLERSYDSGTTFETVVTVTSAANKNITTSGTEETAAAVYRARVSEVGGDGSICSTQFSIRDTSHIGVVEITAVASPTSATATVLTTLGSTDKTHRFSEGSFSNRRGWPIDVTISAEERLTFAGNISEPLTTWGSVIGDFTDFTEGSDDDDAIQFTLIGTGQQNRTRWMLSKNTLVIGTVGGEHLLGASSEEEALTPTNVKAKLQTTYGSENIASILVNQAVLFIQRGGKKIREFLFNFEDDAHKADDLTVFSNTITGDGIVDMAYQRTPDPTLWCIRTDGQIAIMTYERDQNVFSWSRIVTRDGDEFESIAIIFGGTRNEDEVWATVKRDVNNGDVRYVERFFQRDMPSAIADMKFLDSFITDTGGDTTVPVAHLKGETVQVLGDGLVQATKVVNAGTGNITAATTAAKYQVGLGYTSTLKPMKLDIADIGLATTKRINKAIVNVFETIGGEVGPDTNNLENISTGTATLFTGSKEISIPGGYSRVGDIIIRQTDPLPLTALSLTLEVGASND